MARRLTKEIINSVAKTSVQNASRERLKILMKLRDDAGYAIFKHLAGDNVLNKLDALPVEFVNTTSDFDIGRAFPEGDSTSLIDGKRYRGYRRIRMGSRRSLGPQHVYSEVWSLEDDHPLIATYTAAEEAIDDHQELVENTRWKLIAMLTGAKTVEKAIEIWPEGRELLEQYLEAPNNAPAVIVQDVNDALTALAA